MSLPLEFNRYCRVCLHSLRGVVSGRCPECGGAFDPEDSRTSSAYPHGDLWKSLAAISKRLMFLSSVLAGLVVISSACGWAFMHFPGWVIALLMLASLPLMPVVLVIVALPRVPLRPSQRVLAPLLVAIIVSTPFTQWPMRVMFVLHRPWLEPIADRVKAGEVIDGHHRMGLWRFREIFLRQNGNVGFQLNGDAGGGTFLVRHEPDSTILWYNCVTLADLGNRWYLVDED